MKTKLRFLSLFLLLVLLISTVPVSGAQSVSQAVNQIKPKIVTPMDLIDLKLTPRFDSRNSTVLINGKSYRTGLILPNAKTNAWAKDNLKLVTDIPLNKLGAQRVNDMHSPANRIIPIDDSLALPGRDLIKDKIIFPDRPVVSAIPANVDNSTLSCFPPIRDQGTQNSCAAFAAVYYQMTHMIGLARGWNNKNENNATKFSPQFVYNEVNGGKDQGSSILAIMKFLTDQGVASWADYPYLPNENQPQQYRMLPTTDPLWRSAMTNRSSSMSYLMITSTDTQTPVKTAQDESLTVIKDALLNGMVLTFNTYFASWKFTTAKDDPATVNDNDMAGKSICFMVEGTQSGHSMTVVGYNDDVWVDLNKNDLVDPGEKGAFKVANSWGTDYGDQGFCYLAYDALNYKTAVTGAEGLNTSGRRKAMTHGPLTENTCFCVVFSNETIPPYLLHLNINARLRNFTQITLGLSHFDKSAPEALLIPFVLNMDTGFFPFDGVSKTQSDLLFDVSSLMTTLKLDSSQPGKWYVTLKCTDTYQNSVYALTSMSLEDTVTGRTVSAGIGTPVSYFAQPVTKDVLMPGRP